MAVTILVPPQQSALDGLMIITAYDSPAKWRGPRLRLRHQSERRATSHNSLLFLLYAIAIVLEDAIL
jgi:hypothetical protein